MTTSEILSPSYTAQEVAETFLHKYYAMICELPNEIYKFYQDTSMISRPSPSHDGTMINFTTMEEIKKNVVSCLDCKKHEIISFDAQFTTKYGVFLLVIGHFTMKNDEIWKFNQAFFLEPMEHVHGYFISNDILKFLEKQETTGKATGDGDGDGDKEEDEDEDGDVADSTPNPVPNQGVLKKSFLAVVHELSENTAPFKTPPVKTQVTTVTSKNKKGNLEGKKNTRGWDTNADKASIFVGNLTADSKPEELYEAFQSFGPIKNNGIQIRSDKQNRWYAFIQFESSSSAEAAIQASPVRIGNQKLNIGEKKRKDNSESSNFSRRSNNGDGKDD